MVLDHTKVVYTAEDEQGFTFRQINDEDAAVELRARRKKKMCIRDRLRTHYPYSGTEEIMETKLVRIAEISATSKHPIFTSVYHLINEDMLKQCHKELDGNKAVGIDKVTKDEYCLLYTSRCV